MRDEEIERLAAHERTYWWHRAKRTIVRRALLAARLPAGARIVDVGCGTGATSLTLAPFGRVIATDFSADALQHARSHGLPAMRADAGRLPLAGDSIDAVVALDVIEHLDDDAGALREFRRVLRPGGHALITVPAYQFLWSAHDVALEHRRRYTRRSLLSVLRAAGLEVDFCSYVMASVLLPAIVVRVGGRLLPRRREGGSAGHGGESPGGEQSGYVELPGIVNTMLAGVASIGGYLLPRVRMPFGLTVIAVAHRPERSD